MSRLMIVASAMALAMLSGCGSKPTPVSAQYNFDSGRYLVEVETDGPTSSAVNSHFTDNGNGKVEELVEITWGNSMKLRIENGKLTVNGKDLGTLTKGDRIKINSAGKLLVNGAER